MVIVMGYDMENLEKKWKRRSVKVKCKREKCEKIKINNYQANQTYFVSCNIKIKQ